MNKDVRWEQRFSNYRKALAKIEEVVTLKELKELSELEEEGLIQRFEYTYELAWKTLQDLFKHKGYIDILGPTPVLEQALKDGYITDVVNWRKLKKSRELTSHTYNSETAENIVQDIYSDYYSLFLALAQKLDAERSGNHSSTFE